MSEGRLDRRRAEERFEIFDQVVRDTFVPVTLSVDDTQRFHGSVLSSSLGTVLVNQIEIRGDIVFRRNAKQLSRDVPQLIAHHGAEYVKVAVQVEGHCVIAQDGREAAMTAGDYVIYDMARPFEITVSGHLKMHSAILPRELLRILTPQLSRLTARCFSGETGIGAMIAPFIVELARQTSTGAHASNLRLADATIDLLQATCSEQLSSQRSNSLLSGDRGMMLCVLTFIERHLHDPELDLTTIAAAHHISVRHLQRLFEDDGQTVTGWIRDRRIEHCRKDLSNGELAAVSVGVIAARWGLVNAAHFSRLFKAAHGLSPRDYRRSALT